VEEAVVVQQVITALLLKLLHLVVLNPLLLEQVEMVAQVALLMILVAQMDQMEVYQD
jgi:uncharacterized integral membrane protein